MVKLYLEKSPLQNTDLRLAELVWYFSCKYRPRSELATDRRKQISIDELENLQRRARHTKNIARQDPEVQHPTIQNIIFKVYLTRKT